MDILKVRPAWSGKNGKGGAIISLPSKIRKEVDIQIGDSISLRVENGTIVLRKIKEI